MDDREKRLDWNSELGMTRRDLMRRGAIVGGTLLWVAPAIQSMAPRAMAQAVGSAGSPVGCAACYCYRLTSGGGIPAVGQFDRSQDGPIAPGGLLDATDCDTWCKSQRTPAPGNHLYTNSLYCSGTRGCNGVNRDQGDGVLPASIGCTGTTTRLVGPFTPDDYGVICCTEP
jgi:hypothetical protein